MADCRICNRYVSNYSRYILSFFKWPLLDNFSCKTKDNPKKSTYDLTKLVSIAILLYADGFYS